MATLDVFRSTVGAAALGLARRALSEALQHAASRKLFGAPLGDLQMTQASLADMATGVDAVTRPTRAIAYFGQVGIPAHFLDAKRPLTNTSLANLVVQSRPSDFGAVTSATSITRTPLRCVVK